MNVFCEESSVRFAGIDRSDTLSIASIFDIFQEAAISHAEILGVGREAMKQSGHVWILSRLSVFMKSRPKYGEKIITRTWPRSTNKLFAIRDYDIHLKGDISGSEDDPLSDKAIVRGRSAWLIVDIEKRRPLRPQIAADSLPVNENMNALPGENPLGNDPPPSLQARDFSAAEPSLRRSLYSDIDYNGHVNNTRYIQWIQDILKPEVLEKAGEIRLDINYLAEILYGETISLFLSSINTKDIQEKKSLSEQRPEQLTGAFAIEGRRGSGTEAVPAFRAELLIGEKP